MKNQREIKEQLLHYFNNKSKNLGINLPKGTKDSKADNYKTLMKEIKHNTNRWRDMPCSWIGKKNQYCENDHTHTTQSNLQMECNPYQITNGIFHRTRTKNFTICMETQKTPNSQSNLEKEKWS